MMKNLKKTNKFKTLRNVTLVFILIISIFSLKFSSIKYKSLDYSIEKYITSGFFNKHKLYSIENYEIKFSDGMSCIAEVCGIGDKSPYKTVKYNIRLEKNKSGIWKLAEIYTIDDDLL